MPAYCHPGQGRAAAASRDPVTPASRCAKTGVTGSPLSRGRHISITQQIAIAPDVAAELTRWLSYLGAEKRRSPKTLEAYARDAGQFLAFLGGHLGGAPALKQLAKLTPQDVRAFMAARRGEGLSSRSLMRVLAGARSFARFLERNGKGKVGALAAVRAPKAGKTLPKPLAIAAAKRISDTDLREGETRAPWILARGSRPHANPYPKSVWRRRWPMAWAMFCRP